MKYEIFLVDAFTDRLFTGNPAAVCILPEPRDEEWMQSAAKEMNLSETAFLLKKKDGFSLRWFTPTVEIDLCGHATLASAHILWESGVLKYDEEARFHTRSGLLTAGRKDGWVVLDFPAEPEEEVTAPAELVSAIGVYPEYTGRNRFDYLVEVESEDILRGINPDFALLKEINTRGVIVTSLSDSEQFDFVSRFFAPSVGINEDPVTGSAHCCLAPYWHKRLKKYKFMAYQASSRGGSLLIHLDRDRVYIRGKAVTVLKGELLI